VDKELHVALLGRFEVMWDGQPVAGFEHAKARELFSFLLLHRDKPSSREIVANYLWGGHYTTEVSKKYLRKALWQLNECMSHCSDDIRHNLVVADAHWIELKSIDSLWLDVAFIDEAYAAVRGVPGAQIDVETACVLKRVVDLYRGDLLEGEYQEWSFHDLVRYRQVVMILLDKLMDHTMAKGEFESTLEFGERILRHDAAREFTHLKLMRAYYALGDRTAAIRQYNRCCGNLREQLDVRPSHEAVALIEQIRTDEVTELSLVQGRNRDRAGRVADRTRGGGLELVLSRPGLTVDERDRFSRLVVGG